MYHDPKTVLSPKGRVKSLEVVYDAGPVPGSWSVAQIEWDGSPIVGIRWNGDENSTKGSAPGAWKPGMVHFAEGYCTCGS